MTADQVAKLKEMQLNLDKIRIKSEADIQIAERELKALTDDEKSDLGAIEAKLKQSEGMQTALRMTSIKMRREVLGLLTAEQRAKEKTEHEKMMQQHKGMEKGNPHGGGMANPHGGAIALGHPLGMSGARIALTAAHHLAKFGGKRALASMCVGVGQGVSLAIEKV